MTEYAPLMHNCAHCGTEMEKQYRTCRNCKAVYGFMFWRFLIMVLIGGLFLVSPFIAFWQTYQAGKFAIQDILIVPAIFAGCIFIAYKMLRNCWRYGWTKPSPPSKPLNLENPHM